MPVPAVSQISPEHPARGDVDSKHKPRQRIPSLDGLRAVSICLVLVGHQFHALTQRSAAITDPLALVLGNASLGVSIFFVISGYLITTLLVSEYARTGSISLGDFYQRRAFRILPAFAVYFGALTLLRWLNLVPLSLGDTASALTFTVDYTIAKRSWPIQHFWSLAVEEQFYLIWPLLLFIMKPKKAGNIALWIIALSPLIRLVQQASSQLPGVSSTMFHTRLDSLMIGCAAALFTGNAHFIALRRRVEPLIPPLIVFTVCISPVLSSYFGGRYTYVIGYTIEGVSIMLTMLWLIDHPDCAVGKVLNWKPVVTLGVMSYSLYLWQQLFLDPMSASVAPGFPWGLACAVGLAGCSYRMVEQPMLRLRARQRDLSRAAAMQHAHESA